MATIEKELFDLAAAGIATGIILLTAPERISNKLKEKRTGIKEPLSGFTKDSLEFASILISMTDK